LIGCTISHYRVIGKLGGGGWVLSTRPKTQSWAEGRAVNLGEILVGDNHRSKLDVTTDFRLSH
jgi:hypothetical protein